MRRGMAPAHRVRAADLLREGRIWPEKPQLESRRPESRLA
jgi:hypothetical protein